MGVPGRDVAGAAGEVVLGRWVPRGLWYTSMLAYWYTLADAGDFAGVDQGGSREDVDLGWPGCGAWGGAPRPRSAALGLSLERTSGVRHARRDRCCSRSASAGPRGRCRPGGLGGRRRYSSAVLGGGSRRGPCGHSDRRSPAAADSGPGDRREDSRAVVGRQPAAGGCRCPGCGSPLGVPVSTRRARCCRRWACVSVPTRSAIVPPGATVLPWA